MPVPGAEKCAPPIPPLHQAAVSTAFQDSGRPQPNPCPADTYGSWWDGGQGSLEAREMTAGRCSGTGRWCGWGREGGRGQSTGPPPPPPVVAPTNPKRGLLRSREKGQVKEERVGRGGEEGERRKWRKGEERAKEQMEGKERGEEERKVKMGRRGHRQKPGEGEAGPGKGPCPLP